MNNQIRGGSRSVFYFGLVGGLFFTLFFYQLPLGISVPLFLLLIGGGIYWLTRTQAQLIARKNLWLLLPVVGGGLAFAFYENTLHRLLNLGLILLFSLLWAHFMTGGSPASQSLWSHLFILPHVISGQIEKPLPIVYQEVDFKAWQQGARLYMIPAVKGIFYASPVVVVLVVLMYSADVFFAQIVADLLAIEIDIDFAWWVTTGVLTFISGWLLTGWLLYATQPFEKRETQLPDKLLRRVCRKIKPGPIEANTILLVLSLPFAIFVLVQFAFLFDGLTPASHDGLTYAEYARRGVIELILISLMALTVILVLRKTTRFLNPKGSRMFRVLATLLIGFTMVSLISAFKRMNLYEQAFGFTQQRLYVVIGIIWLGFLLGWFVISLWLNPQRFALGSLVAIIGFVGTLNIIQPEVIIVGRNFQRFHQSGELDVVYLTTLSSDAIPALTRHLEQISEIPIGNCQKSRPPLDGHGRKICTSPPDIQYLQSYLHRQRLTAKAPRTFRSWLSYHFGRARAQAALAAYFSHPHEQTVGR